MPNYTHRGFFLITIFAAVKIKINHNDRGNRQFYQCMCVCFMTEGLLSTAQYHRDQ